MSLFAATAWYRGHKGMNKLVFLHGSGADDNVYGDLWQDVARHFKAELITFNAPFAHPQKPGKYRWFDKFENNGRRDAVAAEYFYSLQYIKDKLQNIDENTENIILLGHSQGGGMAVHIGLEMPLKCAVSINGDLPYNISYKRIVNTPIYWFESAKDTYINQERKDSYRLIQNREDFHYKQMPHSTHNDFAADFTDIINSHYIKF